MLSCLQGYLSSLMGNTLMCSHFANSGERSAVIVQLIGIANNLAVLVQVNRFLDRGAKELSWLFASLIIHKWQSSSYRRQRQCQDSDLRA
jgi:hypothetical protein